MTTLEINGEQYNEIGFSSDNFFNDLDFHIRDDKTDTITPSNPGWAINGLAAHINYWLTDRCEEKSLSEMVKQAIIKLNLDRFLHGEIFLPESAFYKFGAISVYEDSGSFDIDEVNKVRGKYRIKTSKGSWLINKKDVDQYGTIDECWDDTIEADKKVLQLHGYIYYFMKPEDIKALSEFIKKTATQLNEIYLKYGVRQITID